MKARLSIRTVLAAFVPIVFSAACSDRDDEDGGIDIFSAGSEIDTIDSIAAAGSDLLPSSASASQVTSAGLRALTQAEPHVEFLITAERKLQVTFLDEVDNLDSLPEQPISIVLIDQPERPAIAFEMEGRVLTSSDPLPEDDACRLGVSYPGVSSDLVDVLPSLAEWKLVD